MKNFLSVLIATTILTGCHHHTADKPFVPIDVSAILIERQTIPANFEFVGVAESSHIIQIRSRVEGYLESINYIEGSMVEAGQLLFVIDKRPFIADLEKAQGVLERQRAILWNAEQTRARMTALYDEDAISERDYDNAVAEEMAAKANVLSAEAALYQADLNLSFASLQAPVRAMSSQAKYREGALISPGEQSLLTTLYVVDPIWVNFSVSDRDLLIASREVEKGELVWPKDRQFEIEAVLSDGTILPSTGFIDFTSPAIQQSTGTLFIRSVLNNPENKIYPGQFVRVIVKGAVRPNCIIIPQTAVVQSEKGPFVYTIDRMNRIVQKFVTLGDWYGDYWVISEGLNPGDLVVAEGVSRIQQGVLVQVTKMVPKTPKIDPTQGTQGKTLGF